MSLLVCFQLFPRVKPFLALAAPIYPMNLSVFPQHILRRVFLVTDVTLQIPRFLNWQTHVLNTVSQLFSLLAVHDFHVEKRPVVKLDQRRRNQIVLQQKIRLELFQDQTLELSRLCQGILICFVQELQLISRKRHLCKSGFRW
jgi:hypothetical protein